jgi:hypothetical protein
LEQNYLHNGVLKNVKGANKKLQIFIGAKDEAIIRANRLRIIGAIIIGA